MVNWINFVIPRYNQWFKFNVNAKDESLLLMEPRGKGGEISCHSTFHACLNHIWVD